MLLQRALASRRYVDSPDTNVSDAGLTRIWKAVTQLESLNLGCTRVTDGGLKQLRGLTQLQTLNLSKTRVTDMGLGYIAGLARLQDLVLAGTRITGTGLQDLKRLTELQSLSLSETKVTNGSLESLGGLTHLTLFGPCEHFGGRRRAKAPPGTQAIGKLRPS